MNLRDLAAGLDHARRQATSAVVSAVSLAKPATAAAGAGLGHVTRHAAAMVSTRDGAVKAAAVVAGGAVGAYFLWPAAAGTAAAMKAPGAAGFVISRAAFLANPQLYFHLLRTVGPKAAVAAFAL
ncbi:hypothetical protein ACP70R_048563 [Stipagrostis hirtigluma subsp. patula]